MLSGMLEGSARLSRQKAADLEVLYETLEVLPFDREAARAAALIRTGATGAALPKIDDLTAGHYKAAGLTLVTADAMDYGRMPGLAWVNWGPAT